MGMLGVAYTPLASLPSPEHRVVGTARHINEPESIFNPKGLFICYKCFCGYLNNYENQFIEY